MTAVESEEVLSAIDRLERALAGPVIDPSLARATRRRLYKIASVTKATVTRDQVGFCISCVS